MVWNILILLFLFYTIIFVPFSLAFLDDEDQRYDHVFSFTEYIDYASNFLFTSDIFIMFVTAVEVPNNPPEARLNSIAISYVKSYFFIDLLSTFPFDLVIE